MINTHSNIFLVGPMGSGKSTIGRILAEILDLKFIDLDCEIEERCGANISWILWFLLQEAELLSLRRIVMS